jgi:DNA-binding IclR family transcriptional regulator
MNAATDSIHEPKMQTDTALASVTDHDEDRYTVPALARGLQLLGYFTHRERELTGAQLSKRTGWPRASVFRMLQTLEQAGFIERCGDGPVYKLGVAVLRLGFEYLASLELTEHGRPIIEALRDSSGYSAHLVIRDAREVVFVAKAAGRNAMFHSIQVGARLPAHATVLGRVLLGGLSPQELAAQYDGYTLKPHTPTTPTTLEALQAAVAADAQRGWGMSQGGFETGISTIAAPVFNEQNQVCAAVSITVPASRIEPELVEVLVAHVRDAASALTQRMRHLPLYQSQRHISAQRRSLS